MSTPSPRPSPSPLTTTLRGRSSSCHKHRTDTKDSHFDSIVITSAGAMSATSSMSITNDERTRVVVFKMNGISSATDSLRGERLSTLKPTSCSTATYISITQQFIERLKLTAIKQECIKIVAFGEKTVKVTREMFPFSSVCSDQTNAKFPCRNPRSRYQLSISVICAVFVVCAPLARRLSDVRAGVEAPDVGASSGVSNDHRRRDMLVGLGGGLISTGQLLTGKLLIRCKVIFSPR